MSRLGFPFDHGLRGSRKQVPETDRWRQARGEERKGQFVQKWKNREGSSGGTPAVLFYWVLTMSVLSTYRHHSFHPPELP